MLRKERQWSGLPSVKKAMEAKEGNGGQGSEVQWARLRRQASKEETAKNRHHGGEDRRGRRASSKERFQKHQ